MNHLIRIDQLSHTQDTTTGEMVPAWTTFAAAVPCKIEPLSASAFIQSRAEQSAISVKVTVPWLDGITATMRLVGLCECHLGKIYNPAGVLEDNITGRQHITLPCIEGVNAGD